MKRFVVFLCTGMMIFSLSACGRGSDSDGSSAAAGSQGQGGVASDSQNQSGAASDSQNQGSLASDSQPQGNGHDYEDGWTEEMEGIKAAVVEELGENYFPNMALLPDMLEAKFGITADMYDDYLAEMPMISANVDTMLIIRAKDGKVKDVEDILGNYRDDQISNTMQYPKNIGVVQASRVESIGNYVCFVQLGGEFMDILDQGDEAVILHCQEMNELVLGIIGQNIQGE